MVKSLLNTSFTVKTLVLSVEGVETRRKMKDRKLTKSKRKSFVLQKEKEYNLNIY